MALPASGAISLSQIQTEFGGANPISLSEYYRGAGAGYVPSGTANGGQGLIAGSGAISLNTFHGTQKFAVTGGNPYDESFTATAPRVTFNTNGTITGTSITGQTWGSPAVTGIGSSYWIMFTSGAGSGTNQTSGTLGTWLSLSTAQYVGIASVALNQVRTRAFPYQLSTDSGGVTIVASGTVNVTIDRS